MAILTVPMSACFALASLRIPLRQGNLHQATHASEAVDDIGERLKDASNIFDTETFVAEYEDNLCTLAPRVQGLHHSKARSDLHSKLFPRPVKPDQL